jgi:hypothetical protein
MDPDPDPLVRYADPTHPDPYQNVTDPEHSIHLYIN